LQPVPRFAEVIKNSDMKKIAVSGVLAFLTLFVHAQSKPVNKPTTKPTQTKPTQKPAAPVVQLKTLEDSANYVIGLSVVNFYRSQGIKKVNPAIVCKAMSDELSGGKLMIERDLALQTMMNCISQQKDSTHKQPVKPALKTTSGSLIKTFDDSANYGMGVNAAEFYKQQGVTRIKTPIVTTGINHAISGKQLFDDQKANNVMMIFLNQQQAMKSKPNIDAGEKFLAENKNKPGVSTTSSGLQYQVLTQGTGAKPALTDTVVCHYRGTFLSGGEFDNSYSRGTPAEFPVTGVIRGWTEVLQLMPVGSKYKVFVPYQLGYGLADIPGIPGGSLLVFEIELLGIKGK
jgi:FKBP-type peptidyl-prolyl cis-trans isomerase